ncbi:hypothetical protein BU16DRAFT_542533 [Lophium mytilinum]|uniref:Uncharacterized protein n=1 Tax=Lophium mytilinum TaxID=390894 RepID=A0A6A6QG71_9PEZI|nr:hypothetical protein BU16DRAFT_542533 [Lophium mytilinum]
MPEGHSDEDDRSYSERPTVFNNGPGALNNTGSGALNNSGSGPANAGQGTQYNGSVGHVVNFYTRPPTMFPPGTAPDGQSAYQHPPMGAFPVPPSASFPAQYPQPQAGRDTFANLGHQQGHPDIGQYGFQPAWASGNLPGTPGPSHENKAPLTFAVSNAVVQEWIRMQTEDPEVDNVVNHVVHAVAPQVYYEKFVQMYQELIDRYNAEYLQGQAPVQDQQYQTQEEQKVREDLESHTVVEEEPIRGPIRKATAWHKNFIDDMVEHAIRNGVEDGHDVKDIVRKIVEITASYDPSGPFPQGHDPLCLEREIEGLVHWGDAQKLEKNEVRFLIASTAIQKDSQVVEGQQSAQGPRASQSVPVEQPREERVEPQTPGAPTSSNQRAPKLPTNVAPQELENEEESQEISNRIQDRSYVAQKINTHVRDCTKQGAQLSLIKDRLINASKHSNGGVRFPNAADHLVYAILSWGRARGKRGRDLRLMIKQEASKLA